MIHPGRMIAANFTCFFVCLIVPAATINPGLTVSGRV
jgi:hypothetical protein